MGEQAAASAFGGVAQLGEHLPCKQGVMSSNLTISIRHRDMSKAYHYIVFRDRMSLGGLAQLGERLPCKQEVSGSNPLISTIWIDSSVG